MTDSPSNSPFDPCIDQPYADRIRIAVQLTHAMERCWDLYDRARDRALKDALVLALPPSDNVIEIANRYRQCAMMLRLWLSELRVKQADVDRAMGRVKE